MEAGGEEMLEWLRGSGSLEGREVSWVEGGVERAAGELVDAEGILQVRDRSTCRVVPSVAQWVSTALECGSTGSCVAKGGRKGIGGYGGGSGAGGASWWECLQVGGRSVRCLALQPEFFELTEVEVEDFSGGEDGREGGMACARGQGKGGGRGRGKEAALQLGAVSMSSEERRALAVVVRQNEVALMSRVLAWLSSAGAA